MNSYPELSIVIVNFRSADFTRKCLQSIAKNASDMDLEIVVIDNDSHDGCGGMVQLEFPSVIFIQGEKNLGFAGANNLAAARCHGRFILFLNPDTEVQGSALQELIECLRSKPDVGMAGARLLNSDLSVQTTSITAFPTITNQVLGMDWLRRRFPGAPLWGIRPLFESHVQPVEVDAISGACMLVRKEVFDAVGGFDCGYFMYSEDLDLCLKVKRAGWKVCYVPSAHIVHHGGQSSSTRTESQFAAIMIRESLTRFMKMHRGATYAAAFRSLAGCTALFRLLLLLLASPIAVIPSQRQLLRSRFAKWSGIARWALGLQTWARQERAAGDNPRAVRPAGITEPFTPSLPQ